MLGLGIQLLRLAVNQRRRVYIHTHTRANSLNSHTDAQTQELAEAGERFAKF